MELTWAAELELKAEKKGKLEGKLEGKKEGEKTGRLGLMRRLLTARFGPLSDKIVKKLEAISSPEALDELGEKLLTARSLEELGLS